MLALPRPALSLSMALEGIRSHYIIFGFRDTFGDPLTSGIPSAGLGMPEPVLGLDPVESGSNKHV